MKLSFQIGNDPMTYIIETEVEARPKHRTSEPRSAREIFLQEVQTQ